MHVFSTTITQKCLNFSAHRNSHKWTKATRRGRGVVSYLGEDALLAAWLPLHRVDFNSRRDTRGCRAPREKRTAQDDDRAQVIHVASEQSHRLIQPPGKCHNRQRRRALERGYILFSGAGERTRSPQVQRHLLQNKRTRGGSEQSDEESPPQTAY